MDERRVIANDPRPVVKETPDVLFVTSTLEIGGSETKIVKIANALSRSGRTVGIAYLNPPDTLLDRIDPKVPVTDLGRRGKFSFESLGRLRQVVGHTTRLVVCVNFYPLLYGIPAAALASGAARTACLINTTNFVDGQWIWGRFYAPFLRRCDELVYGCRHQQALWTRKYRLPAQRSRIIYNGVDTGAFSPEHGNGSAFRSRLGIGDDAVVIGGIGRFAPEKHFDLLIRAVGKLEAAGRQACLVLVGEGAEKAGLMSAVAEAGLENRTFFPGLLGDVRDALSAMDVFVLPSRAVETFSNAALEAMSMARPVVLSNIGGAGEMLVHGDSGYLFESGDVDGLVRILSDLYDSASLRERTGAAARRRVVERFGFDTMTKAYAAMIDSLVGAEPACRQA